MMLDDSVTKNAAGSSSDGSSLMAVELPELYAYTKPLLIAPGCKERRSYTYGALDVNEDGVILFSVMDQVSLYSTKNGIQNKILDILETPNKKQITDLQWIRSIYEKEEPRRFISHSAKESYIWEKRQHIYHPFVLTTNPEVKLFMDSIYFNTDQPETFVLYFMDRKLEVYSVSSQNDEVISKLIFTYNKRCKAGKFGFAKMRKGYLLLVIAIKNRILVFYWDEDDKMFSCIQDYLVKVKNIDILDIIVGDVVEGSPSVIGLIVWRTNDRGGFGWLAIRFAECEQDMEEEGKLLCYVNEQGSELRGRGIKHLCFTDRPDRGLHLFCFSDRNSIEIMTVDYDFGHPFEHLKSVPFERCHVVHLNYSGSDIVLKDRDGIIQHYSEVEPMKWIKQDVFLGCSARVKDLTWILKGTSVVLCCEDGMVQLFSQLKHDIRGRIIWREFGRKMLPGISGNVNVCDNDVNVLISKNEENCKPIICQLVPSKRFLSTLQNYTTINVSEIPFSTSIPNSLIPWDVLAKIPTSSHTFVNAIASSADEIFISHQGEKKIYVYSVTDRRCIYSFGNFETDVTHITLSLDNNLLLAVSRYEFNVYERGDGISKPVDQFEVIWSKKLCNTSSVHYICGTFMGITSDFVIADVKGTISMFESDQIIQTYQTHASDLTVLSCASYSTNFAPNSYFFAAGFRNGHVEFFMWDKVSRARDIPIYGKFFRPHLNRVNKLEFSTDSSIDHYTLASASDDYIFYINKIHLSPERYNDDHDEYD